MGKKEIVIMSHIQDQQRLEQQQVEVLILTVVV